MARSARERSRATPPEQLAERPSLTLSDAARAAGVHRATIRRRLDAGDFPGAFRDAGKHGPDTGPWLIPVDDLLAAGLRLHAPGAEVEHEQPHATPDRLAELVAELAAEREQRIRAEADRDVWRARAEERDRTIELTAVALRALPAGGPRRRWGRK